MTDNIEEIALTLEISLSTLNIGASTRSNGPRIFGISTPEPAYRWIDKDMRGITASRGISPPFAWLFILAISSTPAAWAANPAIGMAANVVTLAGSELSGGWRFVRTPNPQGGPDAVSIMHTADPSRSDLDLAGLMIRCNGNSTEVIVVLLRAFPFRARPHVLLGESGHETRLEATIAPPGTAVLLPGDGKFLSSLWRDNSDLFIRIEDDQTTVAGVVALKGLEPAFEALAANCNSQ